MINFQNNENAFQTGLKSFWPEIHFKQHVKHLCS